MCLTDPYPNDLLVNAQQLGWREARGGYLELGRMVAPQGPGLPGAGHRMGGQGCEKSKMALAIDLRRRPGCRHSQLFTTWEQARSSNLGLLDDEELARLGGTGCSSRVPRVRTVAALRVATKAAMMALATSLIWSG